MKYRGQFIQTLHETSLLPLLLSKRGRKIGPGFMGWTPFGADNTAAADALSYARKEGGKGPALGARKCASVHPTDASKVRGGGGVDSFSLTVLPLGEVRRDPPPPPPPPPHPSREERGRTAQG